MRTDGIPTAKSDRVWLNLWICDSLGMVFRKGFYVFVAVEGLL